MIAILLEIIIWARGLVAALGVFALRIFSIGYITHIIVGLGFGVLTYTGVDAAVSGLTSYVASSWSGVTGSLLQLCTISGIPQGMNMILSAHVSGVAFMTTVGVFKRFGWKGT